MRFLQNLHIILMTLLITMLILDSIYIGLYLKHVASVITCSTSMTFAAFYGMFLFEWLTQLRQLLFAANLTTSIYLLFIFTKRQCVQNCFGSVGGPTFPSRLVPPSLSLSVSLPLSLSLPHSLSPSLSLSLSLSLYTTSMYAIKPSTFVNRTSVTVSVCKQFEFVILSVKI